MTSAFATLRSRRRALGLTRAEMAAGIAMRLADVAEIERGEASDIRMNHYAGWLGKIERCRRKSASGRWRMRGGASGSGSEQATLPLLRTLPPIDGRSQPLPHPPFPRLDAVVPVNAPPLRGGSSFGILICPERTPLGPRPAAGDH